MQSSLINIKRVQSIENERTKLFRFRKFTTT